MLCALWLGGNLEYIMHEQLNISLYRYIARLLCAGAASFHLVKISISFQSFKFI